jgi:hypothetical protein
MREASRKIRGGKLVKLRWDEETRRATIYGDFFLYPEESIYALEDLLSEIPPATSEDDVLSAITSLMEELAAQPVGFSVEDLASLFSEVAD